MSTLPIDGFDGVDYGFLDDAGVPEAYKTKLAALRHDMDVLLNAQEQQVLNVRQQIAVLKSWATVALQVVKAIETVIPLIPTGGLGQPTEQVTSCWLDDVRYLATKLGETDGAGLLGRFG